MVTSRSGNRKNSANTSIIGPASRHAMDFGSCTMEVPILRGVVRFVGQASWKGVPRRRSGAAAVAFVSSGDEFVPLADHVVVLVHHGVPAGDGAHAVVIGAAVAGGAGLLES